MGKSKKVVLGNTVDVSIEPVSTQPVSTQPEVADAKKKMNDKMAALRAKRNKLKEVDASSDDEMAPIAAGMRQIIKEPVQQPVASQQPEIKPKKERAKPVQKNYLTTEDFNTFKNDLFNQLRPVEKIVEREKFVDKIIEKPVDRLVVQQLSGSSLLDEIFFKRTR